MPKHKKSSVRQCGFVGTTIGTTTDLDGTYSRQPMGFGLDSGFVRGLSDAYASVKPGVSKN